MKSLLAVERKKFHSSICDELLFFKNSAEGRVATNADKSQRASREIANSIATQLNALNSEQIAGQTSGNLFELKVADFLKATFLKMSSLRPGNWEVEHVTSRTNNHLSGYDQFHHLAHLEAAARSDAELLASLGNDYTISPDLIIKRFPEPDAVINSHEHIVDNTIAMQASIREGTARGAQMHASVSCKWTMRSDRAQNSRAEALNLIRNRKGRAPHIVAVVAEPTPSRIASLALGTGDLDCVYHFALPELRKAIIDFGEEEAINMLDIMINGRRLKDISDLPLDLCV